MFPKLISLILAGIILFARSPQSQVSSKANELNLNGTNETLKIWVLSDIQPKNEKQKKDFRKAIDDVNISIPDVDFAIVVGDIVNDAEEKDFDWYLSAKPSSYIKDWYEIAGNHDLKLGRGEGYRRKINETLHYSLAKGNILFIFMSNEARGKPTFISDETFQWWRSLVVNNQDKIIVVITHAPLEGSGIPFTSMKDRQILNSRRFTDVLKDYSVDIWLSGHLHLPHSFTNNIVVKKEYKGTIFVNVSSVRTELWGLKDSESRIVAFTCGSDEVVISSRNHSRGKYDHSLEAVLQISKEYKCEP